MDIWVVFIIWLFWIVLLWTCVYVFTWVPVFSSLGHMYRNRIAGSDSNSIFNFLRHCQVPFPLCFLLIQVKPQDPAWDGYLQTHVLLLLSLSRLVVSQILHFWSGLWPQFSWCSACPASSSLHESAQPPMAPSQGGLALSSGSAWALCYLPPIPVSHTSF